MAELSTLGDFAMRMKPTFWFAVAALALMIAAFFIQQAAMIPFVRNIVAWRSVGASNGFDALISKGDLTNGDVGFPELSRVYSSHFNGHIPDGLFIVKFRDARAFVPLQGGAGMLVQVGWSNGQQTDSSYSELRGDISKAFTESLWPWQSSFLILGVLISVGTIWHTHFPRNKPEESECIITTQTKKNDDSRKKADETNPSKED